jgi:hypothetical protein
MWTAKTKVSDLDWWTIKNLQRSRMD